MSKFLDISTNVFIVIIAILAGVAVYVTNTVLFPNITNTTTEIVDATVISREYTPPSTTWTYTYGMSSSGEMIYIPTQIAVPAKFRIVFSYDSYTLSSGDEYLYNSYAIGDKIELELVKNFDKNDKLVSAKLQFKTDEPEINK
jgi:hypothetical protein